MKNPRHLTLFVTLFVVTSFVHAEDPPAKAPAKELPAAHLTALEELKQARSRLAKLSSVSANMVETISMFPRSIRATGRYLQLGGTTRGDEWFLRSELKIRYGGTEGYQLDVCDGGILWNRSEVRSTTARAPAKGTTASESKGDAKVEGKSDGKVEPQVMLTRRNVTQILEAASKRNDVPRDMLITELGLGGMPGLLSAIQQSLIFDKVTNETRQDRPVVVLEGSWNEAQLLRWNNNQPIDPVKSVFPGFIPERAQLVLDKETGFPHRIVYFKKVPDRKISTPLLTIDYTDIKVNQPIDKSEFVFVPPDQVPAMDITKAYLDRLSSPQPIAPGASGANPQPPAGGAVPPGGVTVPGAAPPK